MLNTIVVPAWMGSANAAALVRIIIQDGEAIVSAGVAGAQLG